jgi:signal transduction histidine kinase
MSVASTVEAGPHDTEPTNAATGRILVIDDEIGPRESLRFLFKGEHEILCTDSVDAGLRALQEWNPEVIILDIKMPGKSGIDGLQEIRALEPVASIIMLTGYGSLKTAQQAIRYGANDYVRKPFDTREMRDTVNRHIHRTRIERRRAAAGRELHLLNMRMQRELADKENLAQLGQLSSEFVHDLRNPLSAIYGYVQLLADDLHDEQHWREGGQVESLRFLEIIERNVQRCDEMLRQWRERRNAARAAQHLRLSALVTEAVEGCLPAALEIGAQVIADHCPEAEVTGSPLDLARALQNLLSNALHAVPQQGGGEVQAGWTLCGDCVEIYVRDNGHGIPEESLKEILSPYVTTRRAHGGMGLGLYITNSIVEAHGGNLRIGNRLEGGAEAVIRLPLAPSHEASQSAPGQSPSLN